MMPIEKLLERLEKVKKTRSDSWIARCPSHDDKSPSFSIKELDGGKLLLKCWAGCDNADILASIGLNFSDLFPPIHGRDFDASLPRKKTTWKMADAFNSLVTEAFILALAMERLLHGRELSTDDAIRAFEAVGRIERIHCEVRRYG